MTPQEEVRVLLAMMLCGAALAAVYDALWVLRNAFLPGKAAQAALDLLFGIVCALGVIAAALYLRVDALRLYILFGVLCGMALERISAGFLLRRIVLALKKRMNRRAGGGAADEAR